MRRADTTLMNRIRTWQSDGRTLAADLRKHGDKELQATIERALSELSHPAFTGADNTQGVNSGAVRN